jgi:uncharacterized protein (TIGR03067 family)
MNERTIFLQALEKRTAAERAAYLADACGPDTALRRRVEQLLQSHTAAGSFLGTPALGQDAAATPSSVTETRAPGSADGTDDIALDFLAPATKPDSLGRLDHYEILGVVGRGGMGIVLRAFDEKLHRVVALKVMARDIAGSAAARKRFSREAKAAAAVVHDHIVPIHAIEEAGRTPYLVMQFVEGQSLQQKIDAEGSLELKEILRIGLQIALGLAAAHRQGLVHRDIKPSNILLENGVQRVKITDFGLARAVDDASVSQSGVIAGTPQYMSPEQADGRSVDHRSDLFSLGSVLYTMCTGRPPFRAAGAVATLKRVCEDTPRPIRELNPDLPDWLGDIIARLHAKAPADRFQSAQNVADVLEQHLAHVQQPGQVSVPPLAPTPAQPAKEQALAESIRRIREKPPLLLINLAILALFVAFILIAQLAENSPDYLALRFLGPGAAFGLALGLVVLLRFAVARWSGPTAPPARPKLSRGQRAVKWGLLLIAIVGALWWWFRFDQGGITTPDNIPHDAATGAAPAADLQRLVALQEEVVEKTRVRVEAGMETVAALTAAQVELIEARIRLAEALRKPLDVDRLLRELVGLRQQQLDHAKALYSAGVIVKTEVDHAEKRLLEAQLRATMHDRAPSPNPPRAAQDGRWIATSAEYQGKSVHEDDAKKMFPTELVFKGDQYGLTWGGQQREGTLTIDVTKKPAEMDFGGSVFAGLKPRMAIYELDGDRLKLCLPLVGQSADRPRPTSFTTDPQSKNVVLTYRRAK